MKKNITFILVIVLCFISCNNSNNNNNSVSNKNIINSNSKTNELIKVGIYVYDYPFLYLSNNHISGFDYDIMNEIAKAVNLNVEFVSMQFADLIPSLLSKDIDVVVAGMSITEDRKKLVIFSSKYYSSGQGIIINKENENIKVLDDLIGKYVGVIKGTISDTIISKIEGINVERFDVGGSALLALKIEDIDAVMLDAISCEHYVRYDKDVKIADGISFEEEDYGIAVRKEDTDLLQKINNGLDIIMNNGIYNNLINKHLR